jgi:hypothetical protein
MAVRNRRIESNFLTLQEETQTHITWLLTESHVQLFLFLPRLWIRATASSTGVHEPLYGAGPWLLLHSSCAHGNDVKRVRILSTCRSDHILKLADYHILGMWLVRSKT